MRRRRRPGVTAAPTTAAFATGEGPGLTALATTAVFATGARTTPTLPTRPGLSGMSGSCGFECIVGLDGRDDGLDRDASVGEELPSGAARGRRERRPPHVLVDEHPGDTAGIHRGGEV